MFKFLHAADLHLDSPLRGLDEYQDCPAREIRDASRRAIENMVRLAIEEKVEFVLIAGDVFDGEWKDHNTGLFFAKQMVDLRDAGISVVTIKGNHDAESKIPSSLRLPGNVHELPTDKPSTIHLPSVNVAIHGQGFKTPKITENLAEAYPAGERGAFNIGLLHTCAGGAEGHERYAPCTVESLTRKRYDYDYWALGHVHTRAILHALQPFVGFSGNLQGRHIRETGPKGCLLVSVDDRSVPSIEFRALDVFRWEVCRVDASRLEDGDAVIDRAGQLMTSLLERADDRPLALRIEVTGESGSHRDLSSNPLRWTAALREQALDVGSGRIWVEKLSNRTTELSGLTEDTMGALAELGEVIAELRSNPVELRRFIKEELDELTRGLARASRDPSELIGLVTDDDFAALLDSTRPLIQSLLETS